MKTMTYIFAVIAFYFLAVLTTIPTARADEKSCTPPTSVMEGGHSVTEGGSGCTPPVLAPVTLMDEK